MSGILSVLLADNAAAGGGPALPLDSLSATAAWSTRKLRTAYAGACMNVRRDSDNTAQDIGFTGNFLNTAALLSFVGAGNGFIAKWYDQSGNGFDASQTTNANQPQIVASGAVIVQVQADNPTILWSLANSTRLTTGLPLSSFLSASGWTVLASLSGGFMSTGTQGAGGGQALIGDDGDYWQAFDQGGQATDAGSYGRFGAYIYSGANNFTTVSALTAVPCVGVARLLAGTLSVNLTGAVTSVASGNISAMASLLALGRSYNSFFDGRSGEIIVFNTGLADATVDTLAATTASYQGLKWKPAKIYVGEGDSITQGDHTGFSSYASLFATDSASSVIDNVLVAAKGSSTLNSAVPMLTARAAALDGSLTASTKRILSVLIGVNDQNQGVSTSTFLTDLATYCDARRAAGWKLIICTLNPSTDSGFAAWRATVNTTISGWVGTHADALCDFAANATIGPDAAASNLTYYSDGVHPTAATQTIMESIISPVIVSLA